MKCPQCFTLNLATATECERCGVQFRDLQRSRQSLPAGPITCGWDDHGRACPSRGIVNTDGRWMCREHWESMQCLKPAGRGNYPVRSGRSAWMDRWKGSQERWIARRDRKLPKPAVLDREPGCDDDLDELVAEEAGQA